MVIVKEIINPNENLLSGVPRFCGTQSKDGMGLGESACGGLYIRSAGIHSRAMLLCWMRSSFFWLRPNQ